MGNARVHQNEVLAFIINYKTAFDGVSPSVREIMDECEMSSTSVVQFYLDGLRERGLIAHSPAKSRSIRVVGGKWSYDKSVVLGI
jgi:SOS-response transcriptional repressor LexA